MSSHTPTPRAAAEEKYNPRTAEIAAFENGSPLTCSEIPNLCKDFPDSCACKHIRYQRLWDDKGCVMLFESEKTKYLKKEIKRLEDLKLDFTPSINAKRVEAAKKEEDKRRKDEIKASKAVKDEVVKKKEKYKEPKSFQKLSKADREAASKVRSTNKWTSYYDIGGYDNSHGH